MTDAMHTLLLVEDDQALRDVVRVLFEAHGYRVVVASTAVSGVHDARLYNPDVAIVDLGLPDRDGLEVIKGIRSWSAMPVVVLSARTEERHRLEAFANGADDYVPKPFSAPELVARIKAVSRRHLRGEHPQAILHLHDVSVNLSDRVTYRSDGDQIRLTPLEYRILTALARQPGRVVTQAKLLREVWGPDRADPASLRVFIASLRKKLEPDPSRPRYILTEVGVGYRFAGSTPT